VALHRHAGAMGYDGVASDARPLDNRAPTRLIETADLAPVHVSERARLGLADLDDMRHPRFRLADRDASCGDECVAIRHRVTRRLVPQVPVRGRHRRRLAVSRADIGTLPGARPRREAKVAAPVGPYEKIIGPGPEGSGYAARLGKADSTLPT
jgi:hypothetical protein